MVDLDGFMHDFKEIHSQALNGAGIFTYMND